MSAKTTPLLTPAQARDALDRRGETAAAFARRNGLPASAVYRVLYGINKGRSGNSHRAAVALGIKAGDMPAASAQR